MCHSIYMCLSLHSLLVTLGMSLLTCPPGRHGLSLYMICHSCSATPDMSLFMQHFYTLNLPLLTLLLGCVKFPKSFRNFTACDFSAGVQNKDHQNIFYFSPKWGLRVPQGGSILKRLIFKMFQTNPCGYSKLVSREASLLKDSVHSKHPVLRKCKKRDQILLICHLC